MRKLVPSRRWHHKYFAQRGLIRSGRPAAHLWDSSSCCNWMFGKTMFKSESAFWHFLCMFFIVVTYFSAASFRVAFIPFVNTFRWPQLGSFFKVFHRVKESSDLHQDPHRAGWAGGGPGRCKAAPETHKITSCFSITWAPSCTLSLCGTVVGRLTPVRCQGRSAVTEQGRGHCAVASVKKICIGAQHSEGSCYIAVI